MKTNYLVIVLMSMGLVQLTAREQVSDEITENEPILVSDISTEISEVTGFLDALPKGQLDDAEINGLYFMQEEEKLAHGMYLTLYDQWSLLPFKNISKSEQVHMDAMLYLLSRYGLKCPEKL